MEECTSVLTGSPVGQNEIAGLLKDLDSARGQVGPLMPASLSYTLAPFILNSPSCLLLARSVVVWKPSGFFLFHGSEIVFHFPPVSYIIRIFRLTYFSACHLLSRWYLARLIQPWRWRQYVPPKSRLTFNGIHGVIFQKSTGKLLRRLACASWVALVVEVKAELQGNIVACIQLLTASVV
jgi:hypothetical protein